MRLRCEGCGHEVTAGPDHPSPFACAAARAGDDIDHVLVAEPVALRVDPTTDRTFLRFRHALAASRLPVDDETLCTTIRRLDDAVAAVAGVGFRVTPLVDSEVDGVHLTVKDETGNVAGCHKGRHLMGILLWLELTEALGWADAGRPLAIASCGNAALAAAILARATDRSLEVFVPADADDTTVARIEDLGARVHHCRRRPAEVGDPSWLRFREAVAAGAVPFCCQGPANGLTLDGGRTLAWELGPLDVDHVILQVGGGALASAFVRGLDDLPTRPHIHLVQTAAVAPLPRAVARVRTHDGDVHAALRWAATHRSAVMWPWEHPRPSVARAILDDETHDWRRGVQAVLETGGEVVALDEPTLAAAPARLEGATGIVASPTGTAGLAGLRALRTTGAIPAGSRVLVVASGRGRV